MSAASDFYPRIPKDPAANLRCRAKILESKADRAGWTFMCSEGYHGLLVWLNLFGWLYDPNAEPARRHLPFITWPIQDPMAKALYDAIQDGHDLLIDKTRKMGASWLCIAALMWFWRFVPDTTVLAASRTEPYVDDPGDPKSLFWKARYLIERLPTWMQPKGWKGKSRYMHVVNPVNHSILVGESTNPNMFRGARGQALLLDEFAAVTDAESVLNATMTTAPCRIYNSTPQGMGSTDIQGNIRGNVFGALRHSGKMQVVTLHWRDHPVGGKGAHKILVNGVEQWTSPWYEKKCAETISKRIIAQELDINYLGSGDMFFDAEVIQKIRVGGEIRPAPIRGDIEFDVQTLRDGSAYDIRNVNFVRGSGGPIEVWGDLEDDRPSQLTNFVGFADISLGTGTSNSTFRVCDVGTREEVFAYTSPFVPPEQFGRIVVALCKWAEGQIGYVFIGWEANGPGGIFSREIRRLNYPYVLGNEDLRRVWSDEGGRVGWTSSRDTKRILLGDLRAALARGEYITHDAALLGELEQYITYPNGSVGPSGLVGEPGGAKEAHGDRVIAAAGNVLILAKQPRAELRPRYPDSRSVAGRTEIWRQLHKKPAGRW